MIVFVDDLQWGDVASAPFLSGLMESAPRSVLFVATYRSEQREASPVLARLLDTDVGPGEGFEEISLGPLPEEDLFQLARHSLRATPELNSLRRCVEESQGRPYFLQELLRWSSSGGANRSSLGLDGLIRARADRLEASALGLLEVLAIAGNPVTWRVAERVAELGHHRARAAASLRAGRFVRANGDNPTDQVQTYHDRVREAIVAGLSIERVRRVFRALADTYAQWPDQEGLDRFAVARYRYLGRDRQTSEAALTTSLAAAREAVAAYAFDQAFLFFEQAITVAGEIGASLDPSFDVQFGEACARVGRNERAEHHLRAALGSMDDPTVRAQIRLALARVHLGQLDSDAVVTETGQGFAELGRSPPVASAISIGPDPWLPGLGPRRAIPRLA